MKKSYALSTKGVHDYWGYSRYLWLFIVMCWLVTKSWPKNLPNGHILPISCPTILSNLRVTTP